MRLMIAGWQGQVARALVEVAPGRPDVSGCSVGRAALDICETRSIERALADINPTILINTAAYTAVDAAETETARAFAMNRDGARLLASAAARRGLPIIHLSTDYVFDGSKGAPYTEHDDATPRTVYGASKLAGELEVAAANPRHVILRTAWVHSPFGRNFVRRVREHQGPGPMRVVADQRGSPTYAHHLVDVILAVAARLTREPGNAALWGTFHAAGSGGASWLEVATEVLACDPTLDIRLEPIPASAYPTAAPRPPDSELDCGKLSGTYGIELPPWRQGIAACVERLRTA